MSDLASTAEGTTVTGPARTRSHLLKLVTGVLAGGAALLLWSGAADASTTEQPTPASGLLSGLVGSGGALAPVVELVDGATQTDVVSTTVNGLTGTIDPVAAPVTAPLAPVTDPVVTTVGSIVTTTVGALPPPGTPPSTPTLPGLPGTDPQPTVPELPVSGPDGRPLLPDASGGLPGTTTVSTDPTLDPSTASTAGAPLLAAQQLVESLHDQLLSARGPGADGATARTRDDHPLPTFSDGSPTVPAPRTGPTAPVEAPASGTAACSGPSSGTGPFAPASGTLATESADRSLQAEGVTPSSVARDVRAPSDDPGFAPD